MGDKTNRRGVIVGVFIVLGLAFLVAGILAIGNLRNTFTSKMHLTAIFDDVNGLQKGNNIWFSGVKIGTVKTVRFYGPKHVKVILNIDESARIFIRKDAHVKVSTDGFIGNKIVMIIAGSSNAEMVTEGDTLDVEKEPGTAELMATLAENNKNLLEITNNFKTISGKLAGGQGTLGKILNDESIYRNLNEATSSIKTTARKADDVMSAFTVFSSGLNRRGTLAYGLANDTSLYSSLRSAAKRLNRSADTASALINDLRKAAANPKTPVGVMLRDEEAGANLKNILKNLDAGSHKLDQDLEAMQHSFLLRRYFKKKEKEKKTK